MIGKTPTPEGTVLLQLRRQSGWTQTRLERTTRLSRGTLSLYETGRRSIGRSLLNRLAVTLGHSIEDVDRALAALAQVPAPDARVALTPASLLPHEHRAVEAAAERAAARVRLGVGTRLIEARLRSERLEAANLWEQLRKLPTFRACRDRIDTDSRFRSWALCERLCEEGLRAAARDVDISQGLANLALKVAEKIPGNDAWQGRVRGYAWAFIANSLRVRGDFQSADETFCRAGALLKLDESASFGPLDGGKILAMTAELRANQRRFGEARGLLAEAIRKNDLTSRKAPLLLTLALVLKRAGACEEALEVLEESESSVANTHQPRLVLSLETSRVAVLCLQGKFSDAARRLGKAQRLAFELSNEIDVLRVRWLSAQVAAGMGRKSEAVAQLSTVCQGFLQKKLAHEAHSAALELSEIQGAS